MRRFDASSRAGDVPTTEWPRKIDPSADVVLILAATVAIDQMSHD